MSRITRLMVAAVFCVALMVPAISSANVQRSFNHTFPVASGLCTHATNGHLPKRLASSSDAILAACATLHTSFTDAQNTYSTTVGPLKTAGVEALKTLRQTCKDARQAHTPKVCRTARQATRATIHGLVQQARTAGQTYHASVDAARKAFWTTIKALKGAANVATDPTVPPAPVVAMPSDSQIATS